MLKKILKKSSKTLLTRRALSFYIGPLPKTGLMEYMFAFQNHGFIIRNLLQAYCTNLLLVTSSYFEPLR